MEVGAHRRATLTTSLGSTPSQQQQQHYPGSPPLYSGGGSGSGHHPHQEEDKLEKARCGGRARVGLAWLRETYGSRYLRLLLLNAIFLALWVTRDMASRDFAWVWAPGSPPGKPPVPTDVGGLVGSKFMGLRTLRGAVGPGCIRAPGSGAKFVSHGDNTNITFNIIMTSNGDRPTLQPMLLSILPQLTSEDYLTLISDPPSHLTVAETFAVTPCNCTKILIQNSGQLGWWGHGSRTRWQKLLPGTFHMNADDDDLFTLNAMAIVRHWVRDTNNTMYVFRMVRRWDERIELIPPMTVDNHTLVRGGTVGTPCVVYRADRDNLPDWTGRYGGDGDFYIGLKRAMHRLQIVPEVIYHVGQREDLMPYVPNLLRGIPAEDEEAVKGRREWRRWNPEAPPQFLPAPTWAGTGTWCGPLYCHISEDPANPVNAVTQWVPPGDAPTPDTVPLEDLEDWHRQKDLEDEAGAEALWKQRAWCALDPKRDEDPKSKDCGVGLAYKVMVFCSQTRGLFGGLCPDKTAP